MDLAELIRIQQLIIDSGPPKLKGFKLFVSPSYYKAGVKAAKDKNPAFSIRDKKLFFYATEVVKVKNPFK